VIQGDHHTIAVGTVNAFEVKFNREFAIANKHGRGGQSQNRFARLAEESRQNHLRAVYERMQRAFLAEDSSPVVDAIVVAGPGPMKADFMDSLPTRWHPLTFEETVTTTQAGLTGLQQLVAHMKEACSTVSGGERQRQRQRERKEERKNKKGADRGGGRFERQNERKEREAEEKRREEMEEKERKERESRQSQKAKPKKGGKGK